jgi:flavin reductase (DIM6/NTAB) family NADH-FMN oxidoreductase RutF
MKESIAPNVARRLINHGPIVMVTSEAGGKDNIITVAWNVPLAHSRPLVGVCISKDSYSHGLIERGGEFVINLPTEELIEKIIFCGTVSGRDVDKFKAARLTRVEAEEVKPPLIGECVAHIECKVVDQIDAADHTLFIGEVVAASAERGVLEETIDLNRIKTVHHLGGDCYIIPSGVKRFPRITRRP